MTSMPMRGLTVTGFAGNQVHETAHRYCDQGFEVIPIKPREKAPACQRGLKDASCDKTQIDSWFEDRPDFNIAIVTGGRSRVAVLDVDPRNGGTKSYERLVADYGPLPVTYTVATGGGGSHYYFRVTEEQAAQFQCKKTWPEYPGLDFICGGYVIAPPSIHPSGGRYEWTARGELADVPSSVACLWQRPKRAREPVAAANDGSSPSGVSIPSGSRNDTLFRLGSSLRAKGVGEAGILAELHSANASRCNPPLSDDEVAGIAASVMRYKANDDFALTDTGNARRLMAAAAGDIKYDVLSKYWLVWTGTHWSRDADGEVVRRAKAIGVQILADADFAPSDEARKKLASWGLASQSRQRINAMVELAQSEPEAPARPEQFDTQPHLLNVANGTIDLRTGKLRPHSREDLITKIIPIEYHPDAEAHRWMAFLDQVTGGDPDLARFEQRAAGYGATGETSEQCVFLLYGTGQNGKSTLLSTVSNVLGEYAVQAPTETFLEKHGGGGIPSDLARLRGARFVTASEVGQGRKMDERLIKEVTGGEKIAARQLYGEWFEFRPQFKAFFGTNHLPQLSSDPAVWRRMTAIPFTCVIPDDQKDKNLPAKLAKEGPGILAWIVQGAVDWYAKGLCTPKAVSDATDNYRKEMDVVGAFIDESTTVDPRAETQSRELQDAYRGWCAAQGIDQMSPNAFGRELSRLGFKDTKRGGLKYRKGLKLKGARGHGG